MISNDKDKNTCLNLYNYKNTVRTRANDCRRNKNSLPLVGGSLSEFIIKFPLLKKG